MCWFGSALSPGETAGLGGREECHQADHHFQPNDGNLGRAYFRNVDLTRWSL